MSSIDEFIDVGNQQIYNFIKSPIMQTEIDFSDFYIKKMDNDTINAVFELEKQLIGTGSVNSLKMALNSETLTYYTLIKKSNNEVVGFFEVSIIGVECELYDIAIKKEYQGKHLSDLLMKHLLDLCKEKKCETIFLEVNSINNKAIKLYKKYGFIRYSTRKNYYGKFDAILMKKDL